MVVKSEGSSGMRHLATAGFVGVVIGMIAGLNFSENRIAWSTPTTTTSSCPKCPLCPSSSSDDAPKKAVERGEPADAHRAPANLEMLPVSWTSNDNGPFIVTPVSVTPLLSMFRFNGDRVYDELVKAPTSKRGLVVEVGSFDGDQAKIAVDKGHQVLVLEPSPRNIHKVQSRLSQSLSRGDGRVTLLQAAASSKDGVLTFITHKHDASTGDHVAVEGNVRVGEEHNYRPEDTVRHDVPSAALDDIVGPRRVYMLKVDVQGHELQVLEGARKMFAERRVSFALFEYCPKIMGAKAHSLIEDLNRFGYDTFSLMPSWSRGDPFTDEWFGHSSSPKKFTEGFRPDHAKGMGEWTDILAVCRTCLAENQFAPSDFMQPFDAAAIAKYLPK